MSNIIVWDTETTGLLQPEIVDLNKQPYIIEICCIKLEMDEEKNLEVVDIFETFVKPPVPISEEITKITGIDESMVANSPEFIEIYKDLAEFHKGVDTTVAHNLMFDMGMLTNELARHDLEYKFPYPMNHVCTVEASMAIKNKRMKLGDLYKHVTGSYIQGAHRARVDVEALVECYAYLVKENMA